MNATPETLTLESHTQAASVTSGGVGSSALLGSVGKCDQCARAGKLVMQDPQTMFGQRWVFRAYLCRWHLGASNKWAARMGPHFRQLKPIEFKPDSDLLPNTEVSHER